MDENVVENADETHFFMLLHNGRTIHLKVQNAVKYAEVICGDEKITILVHISGCL